MRSLRTLPLFGIVGVARKSAILSFSGAEGSKGASFSSGKRDPRDHGRFRRAAQAACAARLAADEVANQHELRFRRGTAPCMMPSPLTSIFPAMVGGAEADQRPIRFRAHIDLIVGHQAGASAPSPGSAINRRAKSDLPEPGAAAQQYPPPPERHASAMDQLARLFQTCLACRLSGCRQPDHEARAAALLPSPLPRHMPDGGRFSA